MSRTGLDWDSWEEDFQWRKAEEEDGYSSPEELEAPEDWSGGPLCPQSYTYTCVCWQKCQEGRRKGRQEVEGGQEESQQNGDSQGSQH